VWPAGRPGAAGDHAGGGDGVSMGSQETPALAEAGLGTPPVRPARGTGPLRHGNPRGNPNLAPPPGQAPHRDKCPVAGSSLAGVEGRGRAPAARAARRRWRMGGAGSMAGRARGRGRRQGWRGWPPRTRRTGYTARPARRSGRCGGISGR